MKIPPIYDESEVAIIIGAKDDYAAIDVLAPSMMQENITEELANDLIYRLSVALISVVSEEIETNQVLKTQPLINLCKYMCHSFPELVLDDDTYHIRRSIKRIQDSVEENKDADMIVDAFMEIRAEELDKDFQLQLVAVSKRHGFEEPSKIKIFKYEDE